MNKSLNKEIRLQVYNKYNGHCAYCGCSIEYKDMQVDHIKPILRGWTESQKDKLLEKNVCGDDVIENYNPSCRMCNYYKSSNSLESFRNWALGGLIERLRKIYIFRLAEKYGMITINNWDKKFYFEKINQKQQ